MTWEKKPLADLGVVSTGGTPSRSDTEMFDGNVPFVTPTDLDHSLPITVASRSLSEAGAAKSRVLPEGAVMVCCIGSLGKIGISGCPVATNQQINSVVFDSKLVWPRFGYHACSLLKPTMYALAPATTLPILSKSKFQELTIPLPHKNGKPDIEEQKRIAAILDKADAIRRKRQQALRLTDDFLRSVFLDMFGDPVTNPMGWEETTAGEELEFLTSGSRGWAKYYADEGDLFIRIQNLRGGILDLSDAAYVDAPDSAEAKRTRVQPGDVLLSITADLGRTAVVPEGIGKAHINQHLAILRLENLNPVFVSHLLATPGGQSQFVTLNRSAVKAGLNFDDVRSIRLFRPPPHLQDQFASIVEKVTNFGGSLKDSCGLAGDAFLSLQQRAFRGEL